MNTIVLCEGETDQIILECFFSAECGYENDRDKTEREYKKNGGKAIFYKNSQHELCINPVDGNDFSKKINTILLNNQRNANVFYDYIVVITDHDSNEEINCVRDKIKKVVEHNNIIINNELQNNVWVKLNQNVEFGESKNIELIFIPLPIDTEGALETYLMECLRNQNEYLVDESKKFVECLVKNRSKFSDVYLKKRRDIIKAPLAVFLGITIPEKSFLKVKEMFKSVSWEDYIGKTDGFKKLKRLSGG